MPAQQGLVSIVGAGPGDAGLLTVRARELIDEADAIVYDALVNRDILPADAKANGRPELYYVGKRNEQPAQPPEEVQRLVVMLARQGKRVVHLTNGDPFIFGRGGEAAQAMNDADVQFEIVPGVTAGVAATAYAGIPVTHPGLSASVTFVNGREDPSSTRTITDWRALAKVGGTIVVYNGLKLLPVIATEMMQAGLPGEIPAAAIYAGTRAEQRTVVATLETLAQEMLLAGFTGGVTIVIGWSVLLRDEIAWFDRRPLFGKRIAVIQSMQGISTLREQLRDLGAEVITVPPPTTARLDLAPMREDIEHLQDYGWIVFASPDAVTLFWEQLLILGRDTRWLAGIKVCAIGGATAAALLDRGVTVDVLPERFEGSALLDILSERSDIVGQRMLYVCDDDDDGTFPEGAVTLGAGVIVRAVYRYVPSGAGTERIRRRLERGVVDLVVFASQASVAHYIRCVGAELSTRAPAAALDDVTADALRSAGIEVVVERGDPGAGGFADSIVLALGSGIT